MDRVMAREFIDNQIPIPQQDALPGAFRRAYSAVAKATKSLPFMKAKSAEYGRGHLVAWAVDYELSRLVRDGVWPYPFEWVPFHKPTGVYLRIDTGGAFVTASQVPFKNEAPRHAKFRANATLSNYPLLPFDEFKKEAEKNNRKHLVIGHGYQSLNFVVIAAPDPTKSKKWIDRTDNLLLPRTSTSLKSDLELAPDLPTEEGADITIDMELVEHIEKQIRDGNG